MSTYIMKIRPHFLDSVRKGTKQHEYRLGTPERRTVKPGDSLILISNQDPSAFVRAKIEEVHLFPDWDSALDARWGNDFKGVYDKYEDLIRECHRFYTADQVKQYGVVVYSIKPERISYTSKRYLLDTNIVIHRESQDEALPIAGKLYHWIDHLQGKKLFHPSLRDELNKYKDKAVVQSLEGKLEAYEELVPISEEDAFFKNIISNENDNNAAVDNSLLLQVHAGRADFLLTEDKGILRKAEALYLRDRVLTSEEFVHLMEEKNPTLIDYEVLSVKKEKIGKLPINDPFFDTLREDYGHSDFNGWLNGKSGEDAYIFKNGNGVLQGFLYLKREHEDEPFVGFDKPMPKQEWLKVGTFKNATKGRRVGERFLKIIFDNALLLNVDGIYVTLFEGKRPEVKALMGLMKKWGFVPYCHNKNGELVMIKDMRHYDDGKGPMFNYPLMKPNFRCMFLPIVAEWHGKLFPDDHLKNEDMSIYEDVPCSYALEKIYVCGWRNINAKPGDLLFIYRVGERWPKKYSSVISGTAILQEVLYPRTEEEYLDLVKNKSVFSDDELKSFYRSGKYRTIIKLLFLKPFGRKITLQRLYDLNIVEEMGDKGPRINTFINIEDAKKLAQEGEGK